MHLLLAMLILAGFVLSLKLLNTRAGFIAISVLVGIIALFFLIWLHNDSYQAPAQVSYQAAPAPKQWFYISTTYGTGEPVTHGPFSTYDAAIADCQAAKLSGTCGGHWFWRTDQPTPTPPQPAPQPTPAAAQAERSSDPYQQSLQALVGEKLTPLN